MTCYVHFKFKLYVTLKYIIIFKYICIIICGLKLKMTYYTKINSLHNNTNTNKANIMKFNDTNELSSTNCTILNQICHNGSYKIYTIYFRKA